jgi:hypothetical protein
MPALPAAENTERRIFKVRACSHQMPFIVKKSLSLFTNAQLVSFISYMLLLYFEHTDSVRAFPDIGVAP